MCAGESDGMHSGDLLLIGCGDAVGLLQNSAKQANEELLQMKSSTQLAESFDPVVTDVPSLLTFLEHSVNVEFCVKQADSAVQLKGGSVVRMDQNSQYAYIMQHVAKVCGAPADAIQLFWCNAWRKRTLIRPTNSTPPHTVRGAPSTLKSMILNLADTGKPFTLEYEVTAWP